MWLVGCRLQSLWVGQHQPSVVWQRSAYNCPICMQLGRQPIRIMARIACTQSTLLISDLLQVHASLPLGPCSSYLRQAATAAAFGPATDPSAHPCSCLAPTAAYPDRCCSACSAHKPSPVRVMSPCRGTLKHVLKGRNKDDDPRSLARNDVKACTRTSQVHWEALWQSPQYAAASMH